jgi:hypothetical protein
MARLVHWGGRRLLLGLVAGLLGLGGLGITHASINTCRTDPTVYLSNGVSVQLWDTAQTDISDVSAVYYTLHVPHGVSVTSIDYDSTGSLEHVAVVADQSGTHYSDVTTLDTVNGSVQVSGSAIRRDGTTATKTGTSDTSITLNWCT